MARLVLTVFVCAGVLTPQSSTEFTYHFVHIRDASHIEEIATAFRVLASGKEVSLAPANGLTVRGDPRQIELGAWLLHELDRPEPSEHGTVSGDFRPSMDSGDQKFRVLWAKAVDTLPKILEMTVSIRTMANIRILADVRASRAVVLWGTPAQLALGEWLVGAWQRPIPAGKASATDDFRVAGEVDDVAKVFYLGSIQKPQELQEFAVNLRTMGDISLLVTNNAANAIAIRSTSARLSLAAWLLSELDAAPSLPVRSPVRRGFQPTVGGEHVVEIFWLPSQSPVERLQQTAVLVRSGARMAYVGTCATRRALILRGSLGQIAQAEQIIRQANPVE